MPANSRDALDAPSALLPVHRLHRGTNRELDLVGHVLVGLGDLQVVAYKVVAIERNLVGTDASKEVHGANPLCQSFVRLHSTALLLLDWCHLDWFFIGNLVCPVIIEDFLDVVGTQCNILWLDGFHLGLIEEALGRIPSVGSSATSHLPPALPTHYPHCHTQALLDGAIR